jgi:quercetin 2,3-dioxygenase
MNRILYTAAERGFTNLGWLKSWHTFNFANYFEENKNGFGKLLVLNENKIQPDSAFGTHSHDHIEMITIPLEGRISHKDNLGNEFILAPGDIQVVSAGTGLIQREKNASETEMLHYLEIWILPDKKDLQPRYMVNHYDPGFGNWVPLIRPDQQDGCISINQQFLLFSGKLRKGNKLSYTLTDVRNGLFIHVISGSIRLFDEKIQTSDSIGIKNEKYADISCQSDAHFLLMEIPFDTGPED